MGRDPFSDKAQPSIRSSSSSLRCVASSPHESRRPQRTHHHHATRREICCFGGGAQVWRLPDSGGFDVALAVAGEARKPSDSCGGKQPPPPPQVFLGSISSLFGGRFRGDDDADARTPEEFFPITPRGGSGRRHFRCRFLLFGGLQSRVSFDRVGRGRWGMGMGR